MSTFITRVELHGVLSTESQSIYDALHAEMLKQKFVPTIASTLDTNKTTYHLPSAMYSSTSVTLNAAQVRALADAAVAATQLWATQNSKKSVFTYESLTVRADNWSSIGLTPVE